MLSRLISHVIFVTSFARHKDVLSRAVQSAFLFIASTYFLYFLNIDSEYSTFYELNRWLSGNYLIVFILFLRLAFYVCMRFMKVVELDKSLLNYAT